MKLRKDNFKKKLAHRVGVFGLTLVDWSNSIVYPGERPIRSNKKGALILIILIIIGYFVYCVATEEPKRIKLHVFYTDPVARQTTKRMLR